MPHSDDEANRLAHENAIEYARPTSRAGLSRVSRRILWCAVAVVGVFIAFTVVVPLLNHRARMSPSEICRSNMRQLGVGIAMFANEHSGKFPDDLPTLFANEDLDTRVFICPATGDTPAPPAPTTQAIAVAMRQPGHCSYIYLGKGLTDKTVTTDMVLLYEPLADHGGTGMNVLFGDFHVEWMPASDAQTILNQVAARTMPVRLSTTLPTTAPAAGR